MSKLKKFWIFTIILVISIITSVIVVKNRYVPESKAEEKNIKTIQVTYKSGIGEGEDVVANQTLCDSQTQGANDYTDGKIVLYRNGENGINFTAEQIKYEANNVMYDRILTGWKLTSVIKDGTEITNFIEPENQNYADRTNANKDIGTVYAQKGWYIVPDGVTAITVEAVYARAIYVRSPFDKMYYDEFHIFYYGENNDGTTTLDGTAVAKSSDDNDGSTVEKAVSTLRKAYNLMTASSSLTVYDTAFVLCGDMYEINYNSAGSKYATGEAGTYTKYTSGNFGYNSSTVKPVTITNDNGNNYKFYTIVSVWQCGVFSSLRLDNLYMSTLSSANVKKVHSDSAATVSTYPMTRQFEFYNSNAIYETTETLTTNGDVQIRYKNMKSMKLNGGYWSPVQSYDAITTILNNENYIYIGGRANINYVTTGGIYNKENSEQYITNPFKLIITGGKVNAVYGTARIQKGSVKGNVNIFISGGNVTYLYGGGNGSVYSNGDEKGDVNIDITGGTFKNIYGGGQYYTSKVCGDVNIKIQNAKVTGNLYGGGRGGKIQGTVYVDIKDTSINGNCFGGGFGLADSLGYTEIDVSSSTYDNAKSAYNKEAQKRKIENWEEAPRNFPMYNQETAEIIGLRNHSRGVQNNEVFLYGVGTKYFLTLANVEKDININIENSTIEKNVYGGGSVGLVEGNVNINIKNTDVKGNIYGGGDGKTTPATIALYSPIQDYKELTSNGKDNNTCIGSFSWTSDIDILTYFKGIYDGKNKVIYNSDNTTTTFSELSEEAQAVSEKYGTKQLVYSSDVEKLGFVEGDITVNIDGGTYSSAIYGGGNNGQVKGNVTLEISNVESNQNIYTGGNTGNVEKSTKLTINSGTYEDVFGGGYSGKVLGDSTVIVNKGTCANIFGGGDQSYVQGNTDVTIGQENSSDTINVTGLVYGGGRGYDANNDGDASDFTTVYGSSTVLVQGINTLVENYGSTKLGAVAGNVDVNFKNYWSGNSTAKYKTMNGIDRATTVSFDNSYVLLENKDETKSLVGIKAIENLKIPKGSGLKISANGEITGNFEGGGELYLDSLVCLTVQGNITGKTTLVLNPKLMEDGTQGIRGGINVPYLKVAGTAPEPENIALVSGETNKYVIIQADKDTVKETTGEEYIYYYIAGDVTVENNITIETNSENGRKYKDKITNTNDVLILNTGTFTTDMNVSYYVTDDAYKNKDYSDIERKLKLISNTDQSKTVTMPVGTEITMVTGDKYYSYVVDKDNIFEIGLSDFEGYSELKDITNSDLVDKSLNEVNGTTTYTFKENYKFIFNFANSKGIEVDRYYPSFEIYYTQTSFGNEKKDVANNIVDMQKRSYGLTLTNDKNYYEADGNINLTGQLKIGSLKENTYIPTKDLYLKIKLKDNSGNEFKIPQGTQVTVNDAEYNIENGQVIFKILDNLDTTSVEQNMNIAVDMSGILPQDRLTKGEYKIVIEYLNSKEYKELEENNITIIDKQTEYGLSTIINQQEGIASDKIQIIKQGQDESRSIKIKYSNSSELQNMKIKIKAVERTGEFEYKETNNSQNKIDINMPEIDTTNKNELEQNVNVTFKDSLKAGTYRILVELYDEYGQFRTCDYVNFIVN